METKKLHVYKWNVQGDLYMYVVRIVHMDSPILSVALRLGS